MKRKASLGKFIEGQARKAEETEAERVKAALQKLTKKDKKGDWTLVELSRSLDASVPDIEKAVEELEFAGYDIAITEGVVNRLHEAPRGAITSHISRINDGGWLRFGVLGDNQGGNRHERLDVLATAYEHYKREGITTVYHTGNMIDGYNPRLNGFELLPEAGTSMEQQVKYIAARYPKVKGIDTHFITGECHEGWWAKGSGLNIGRFMQNGFRHPETCKGNGCKVNGNACATHGRTDLHYIGHLEADIELRTKSLPKETRGPIMRVSHPGGGTAYALSYTTQQMANSLQGGEKPSVQLVGHYHKFDVNYWREIWNVQTGCLCDQTIFMRKKNIAAHVGYLIVEMFVNPDGTIQRFRPEFVPFFDQGFFKTYSTW